LGSSLEDLLLLLVVVLLSVERSWKEKYLMCFPTINPETTSLAAAAATATTTTTLAAKITIADAVFHHGISQYGKHITCNRYGPFILE